RHFASATTRRTTARWTRRVPATAAPRARRSARAPYRGVKKARQSATQYTHKGRLLGSRVDDRRALVRELFRRQLSRRLRPPVERRGRRTRGQLRRAGAGAEGGREPARPLLRTWAPCATAGAAAKRPRPLRPDQPRVGHQKPGGERIAHGREPDGLSRAP